MKILGATLLAVLALAGCSRFGADDSPPAQARKIRITPAALQQLETDPAQARYDGYGPVRFGMDDDAFRAAWITDIKGAVDHAGVCSMLHPSWIKPLSHFSFVFAQNRFVRYDVAVPGPLAPGGGKVGMSVPQLQAQYGHRLRVSAHPLQPRHQLLRTDDGSGHVLIFETGDDGKVSRWRVGLPPQIDNEDGCM